MSNLHDEIAVLQERWSELQCMIDLIDDEHTSPNKQTIYLKAAFLMLCSHFEGGFYDILHAILNDINDAEDYSCLPPALVKAYIKYSMFDDHNVKQEVIDKISKELQEQKVNLQIKDDFLNHSSNLTPKTVKRCCQYFDVPDITKTVLSSDFEIVFQNNPKDSSSFIKQEIKALSNATLSFPYNIKEDRHQLKDTRQSSLFTTFLINLINKRNKAVHGGTMSGNNLTSQELKDDLLKIQSFTLAEIYCFGCKIQTNYKSEAQNTK